MIFSASTSFDSERASAFARRMTDILNHAAVALMISIGHRTGLFDVMAQLESSPETRGGATSSAIAQRAGLHERYVREWLAALATAGIVELDSAASAYRLPAEHAASLTRAARPRNAAASCQWIAVLAGVESAVVDCFAAGGGVETDAFERFHAVMAEESDRTVVAALRSTLLPSVPGLVARLDAGAELLDVGCGSGRALAEMAAAFPRSRFVGIDSSEQAIDAARCGARMRGLDNLAFERRDAAELRDEARFDVITAFGAIHELTHPEVVLAAIARALRPGGVFLMQNVAGTGDVSLDCAHPLAPFLYAVSCIHGLGVSLARDGEGLGTMWGEPAARRMLRDAGLCEIVANDLPHDAVHRYFVARKLAPRDLSAA